MSNELLTVGYDQKSEKKSLEVTMLLRLHSKSEITALMSEMFEPERLHLE